MARIAPLEPPFPADVGQQLEGMMPTGVPPIGLFRTIVRNLPMTQAMGPWGRYELSRGLSLTMRDREVLIDRTTARCACEYEWGVHISFFAERVGLTPAQIQSLTHGAPSDGCWDTARDRLLIQAADELHDRATISDALWAELAGSFSEPELLDVLFLCGWYHAISYAANATGLALEAGAPRFDDVA